MNKTALIYLSDSYFPSGTAYASRVLHICKAFQMLSCDTYVIADRSKDITDKHYDGTHDNIRFTILNCRNALEKYKQTTFSIDSIRHNYPSLIIVLGGHDTYRFPRIKKKYEAKGVKIVLECCEWYDVSSYKLRRIDPRFLIFNYCIRHVYVKSKYVIAISSFLFDYFNSRSLGACVLKMPTILDIPNIEYVTELNNRRIRIMFAGFWGKGKKENFENFITALSFYKRTVPFEVVIFGGSYDDFKFNLGDKKDLLDRIKIPIICNGIVDQKRIETEYRKSDFSIIFRPKRRSSEAGFPTKLAESMAAGTPVIANDTGDIGEYVTSGKNGFLCENDPKAIKKCLDNILEMKHQEFVEMRINARKTAEEYFDFRNYVPMLNKIVEG